MTKSFLLSGITTAARSGILPFLAVSLTMAGASVADQTWSGASDAMWSNSANWITAVPAPADVVIFDLNSVVNFATTLGADFSVAGIKIADPSAAISIAATNTLTLGASGIDMSLATQNFAFNNATVLGANQTWNVGTGRTLLGSVTAPVSGGFALTKTGAGILTLQGVNTFSGGVALNSGTLIVKNNTSAGTGGITLANGTTLRIERNGSTSIFVGNAVTTAAGASVVMTTDNAANGFSGLITGDATSVYQIGNAASTTQVSFSLGASTQQFGSFAGTVKIFDGASLRFSATSAVNNGGANTNFDLNTSGVLTARNTGTINVGALTGIGSIIGSSGAAGTTTFAVGGKNVASTYNGVFTNASTTGFAAVTKTGTDTLTLNGASTYSGATVISAGRLLVNGSNLGFSGVNSAVTVAAAGTLGGTGTLSGAVTVTGTIAPGAAVGTLTITNALILNSSATLSYELNGTDQTAGGGINDLLTGITTLTLDGTLNVASLGAFTGRSSGSWRLINYSGVLTDSVLNLGTMPVTDAGTNFAIDTATAGQVNLVLVPEPGTALLGLVAGLGLLRRGRV